MSLNFIEEIENSIQEKQVIISTQQPATIEVEIEDLDGQVTVDTYNKRLKFFDVHPEDMESQLLTDDYDLKKIKQRFSKLIAYGKPKNSDHWEELGFQNEATIHGFFENGKDAEIWSYYLDSERSKPESEEQISSVLITAKNKKIALPKKPEGYKTKVASKEDAKQISEFLKKTFSDYPSDLSEEYIQDNIKKQTTHYRMIFDQENKLASVASAEINHEQKNAELTDCATDPIHRNKGLIGYNLTLLENDVLNHFQIKDLYTMARAREYGMNCAFAKLGYQFTGTLTKNCRMPTGWESINIWCKEVA